MHVQNPKVRNKSLNGSLGSIFVIIYSRLCPRIIPCIELLNQFSRIIEMLHLIFDEVSKSLLGVELNDVLTSSELKL